MGKLGAGMKPRGQKEKTVKNSPITVGQQEVSQEPVLGVSEIAAKPSQAEAENEAILEASVVASDQENEASDDGLEAAMGTAESVSQGEKPEDSDSAASGSRYSIGIDAGMNGDATVVAVYDRELNQISCSVVAEVGPQPDGSHKAVVTLPEGWWEPVTQWADEAGISPEDWLSARVFEYIESYGLPAGKR